MPTLFVRPQPIDSSTASLPAVYSQPDDIAGFSLFLRQRRGKQANKPTTRDLYVQQLKLLLREVPTLDEAGLLSFFSRLLESGRKASYVNRLFVVLHVYGEYKQTERFKSFRIMEEEAAQKSTMSEKEIEQFLSLSDGAKWNLFWQILCFSGMRAGEVASLTKSSVDVERGVFHADGKTGPRIVPIAPAVIPNLKSYLGTLRGHYLFPGSHNTPITRQGWGQMFDRRAERLGIKRPGLSAHSLRHSFITRMLDEDVNLFKVQKIVGHRKLETTQQYTHLTTKGIVNAMKKDPLGRSTMSPSDVLHHATSVLRDLAASEDSRFEYAIQETPTGVTFAMRVKDIKQLS